MAWVSGSGSSRLLPGVKAQERFQEGGFRVRVIDRCTLRVHVQDLITHRNGRWPGQSLPASMGSIVGVSWGLENGLF